MAAKQWRPENGSAVKKAKIDDIGGGIITDTAKTWREDHGRALRDCYKR